MTKQQRKTLYVYLSETGYVFNRERHKKLKQLLTGKVEEEEPELYEDNDPTLLHEED